MDRSCCTRRCEKSLRSEGSSGCTWRREEKPSGVAAEQQTAPMDREPAHANGDRGPTLQLGVAGPAERPAEAAVLGPRGG